MKPLHRMILGVLMYCVLGVAHAGVVAPDVLIKDTVDEVIGGSSSRIRTSRQAIRKKSICLVDAKVLPAF